MLIDTHCHLDFPDLAQDCDAVVERARRAGVKRMITISTHYDRAPIYRRIAERYDDVYWTTGIHPHHAAEMEPPTVEQLCDTARHPKCVGIGEAGLDYHYNYAPPETAQKIFRLQITAARASGLPLIIHTRDADADMAHILKEEMGKGIFCALLHCFTSSRALAEQALAFGFYISFSGVVTFKKSDELRAIARDIPLNRILIETDAPFLAPAPYRGKRNEPAYVAETAKILAETKGLDYDAFSQACSDNALRVFSKIAPFSTFSGGASILEH